MIAESQMSSKRGLAREVTAGRLLVLGFGAALAFGAHGHGGIPPAGVPNYPAGLIDPPSPNRSPVCSEPGANGPCGLTESCLVAEPAQALAPGQNRYSPGQVFEIPWLISVTHGNGNAFEVALRHPASGRQDPLLSNFPQGNGRQDGDVISLSPIAIPTDFPAGAAVIEAYVDVGADRYYDCVDLQIQRLAEIVFSDGFEF